MDILIKSFNRPYYLDRCLYSIDKHVKLGGGKIILLDDGTPQIYLDKLKAKYPHIIIEKSELYEKKQQATGLGKSPDDYSIPIDFWVASAQKASPNFMLIEDDIWFVEDIDLESVNQEVTDANIALLKLFWVGNPLVVQSKSTTEKKDIVLLEPKLFTIIPALYYFIFYKFDRFKIRKTLRLLKINTDERHLAYYTLYGVAGAIFNKDYFIQLWQNHKNYIDEGLQIYNAVKFYAKQGHDKKYARYKKEILKTGFVSSATNQYKEDFGENVDMFMFNKMMNEAWLQDKLDVISSLPNDIDEQIITTVLDGDAGKRIVSKDWKKWMQSFKNQYIAMGCKID
ncbi:hypothetical protein [Flavobacterium phycosphaerae]|uniref:hypothetical protein n=1 Tax=Flavobacterium phycosphaerae TaxID=2697515 RepID=UPI0013898922|nr:hypothetical protein [Flavobacterium phycosphaerae]